MDAGDDDQSPDGIIKDALNVRSTGYCDEENGDFAVLGNNNREENPR